MANTWPDIVAVPAEQPVPADIMMHYGLFSMARDLGSSLYEVLISLCCTVGCTITTVEVGERKLKVVRQLAEGGFSYVYLVEAQGKGKQYALKKVLAQLPEQCELARWEITIHKAFDHPHLMPLIDHAAVRLPNGAEEFRLLMPLFPSGTLLDRAMALKDAGRRMGEEEALRIFAQLLDGVRQFHDHSPRWSHRDIKPANVLLGEGDSPVLMDFGSAAPARKQINSRTEALLLQEDAAQNCSMPYRAPELFDVPSDAMIDERTDVFSLGATLYAMVWYYSPFECTFQENVQRIVECTHLGVIGGAQFPAHRSHSAAFTGLIEWMLTVSSPPQETNTHHLALPTSPGIMRPFFCAG